MTSKSAASAFSMIELLVVIAILGILISLLVPAFSSIGQSNRLTSGAQILIAEMNRCRQEAISKNRAVEVRIYTVPPKDEPGNASLIAIRAIRGIVLDETAQYGTNSRAGRLYHLPSGIQISSNTSLTSTVLSTNETENIPVFGTVNYMAFRFRPNGGTDLSTNAHWTLIGDRMAASASPANFATIQIDSRTGRVRLFRP